MVLAYYSIPNENGMQGAVEIMQRWHFEMWYMSAYGAGSGH